MLRKKKKLSKKEIKEDKLITTYYKALGFFEENKKRIMTFGGIIVAVIAIVWFISYQAGQKNEKAGLELSRVMTLYDNGSYLEAIEGRQGTNVLGLKKIVDEYGSTENGETAKIYLANAYSILGRLDDAYKYYEDYDGSIEIYQSAALVGQADYFSVKSNFLEAAELFLKASKISASNVFNSDYLLKSAINFIKAGKKEKAKDILNSIKADYPNSQAAREIDRYLLQIES
jgi:tetratricopeptide (TPR) repeat protein